MKRISPHLRFTLFIVPVVILFFLFGTSGNFANGKPISPVKIFFASPKWEKLTESLSEDSEYLPVIFFDSNNGFGLRHSRLEKTSDGGKTWEKSFGYENKGDDPFIFTSLIFPKDKNGWITGGEPETFPGGYKPLILTTRDKGLNWQKIKVKDVYFSKKGKNASIFFEICFDKKGIGWIASDKGVIKAKIENQVLKVLDTYPTNDSLGYVSCTGSDEIWASGLDETILHYKNGWKRIALGNEAFLKSKKDHRAAFSTVKVIGDDIWVIGYFHQKVPSSRGGADIDGGILLRSKDNGRTWENKTPVAADGLFDIHFQDKEGWLVGKGGGIYYTNNKGESWAKQESPTENDLYSIFFLNENTGWIGGDKGTILRYRN